jgi:hypothetical protein
MIRKRMIFAATIVLTGSFAVAQSPVRQDTLLPESVTRLPWVVMEPSAAQMGNTVFMTGNLFALLSTDAGRTFRHIDPRFAFPEPSGPLCCDQVVVRSTSPEMIFWYLEYDLDATGSNTVRLARAAGEGDLAAQRWSYWDFTAQALGFPAGDFLDGPGLEVGAHDLYVSSNVYRAPDRISEGSVVWRISLSELAAGGAIHWDVARMPNNRPVKLTSGASTEMYWASHDDASHLRVWRWEEGAPAPTSAAVVVAPWPRLTNGGSCPAPDGNNACGIIYDGVTAGWIANGELGFLWMAGPDARSPYPHVEALRLSETGYSVASQDRISSPDAAWIYPAARVNARGDVGGVIVRAGPSIFPETRVWIVDRESPSFSSLPTWPTTPGTNGPAANNWGDYLTAAPHPLYPNAWIGTGYHLEGGTANRFAVAQFLVFGRDDAFPPEAAGPVVPVNPPPPASISTR